MEALQAFVGRVEAAIITPLITLVALAAFLVFLWGVVDYIRAGASDGKEKADGRKHMLWGIVGLAIIFGAQAIVAILGDTANSVFPAQ